MLVIVAPVPSSRLAALAAAALAAIAALASSGAIAFSGPRGGRLGVLLLDTRHLLLAVAAASIVFLAGARGARGRAALIAVSPLILLLLPWLPFPVPAACLIWTGALASLVWIAVGLALLAVAFGDGLLASGRLTSRPFTESGSPVVAGALALAVFASAAWFASPSIPGGDEPHYLVITQSLLHDGDLKIEDNHQRGEYRAYFAGDLAPDSVKRGRNGAIYSIHAPGVSTIVLPAFAIGGYRGVVVFLLIVSAAACALAWYLAWRASGSRAGAWFGWAAISVSAPWLLETFTVYPDGPGAVIVLTGFWALLRAGWEREGSEGAKVLRWFFHGLALALLPWLHTRFSVLAATLGGLILVRLAHVPNAMSKAIAFLLPPAASAVAWMFFFAIVYGAPDPSAPYGGRVDNSFAFLPNGLGGLLFDQGFGLLMTAPVIAVAFFGFTRTKRLAVEWLVVAAPYLMAVATFAMWWAGMSGPARFLVPLLLPLAIPAACAWATATSRGARAVMLAALLTTAWLGAVMAGGGGGRLGYHTRNEGGVTPAPWIAWATSVVDLPSAFPAFVPLPVGTPLQARTTAARTGFVATLPWLVVLGGAAFALKWWIDRREGSEGRRSEGLIAASTLTFGAAAMIASAIVWRIHGADPTTPAPAQLQALRVLSLPGASAIDLTGRRRMNAEDAWRMEIELPVPQRAGRGGPRPLNRPLVSFPAVPAGTYVLSVHRRGGPDGWIMAGVGNDQFAIVTRPVADYDAGVRLDLPVDVRALNIRTDEGARDQLDAIVLRPIARAGSRLAADVARRAVRYDTAVIYFLDDRAFPEPSGFWAGGARETAVAIQADRPAASIALIVRNAPVDNQVVLDAGARREEMQLKPGEERRVEVPLDAATGTALLRIRSASGFRPSEVDANSRDTRFLGIFVRIANERSE